MSLLPVKEKNEIDYKNAIKPYLEEIKPFFDYETCEFNSQGGFGLELIKNDNTIFIWLIDPDNSYKDLLPEDFDNSKNNYKISIQTEFIKNGKDETNTFDNIDSLVKYLAENTHDISIEESKELIKTHQSTPQHQIKAGI